MRRTHLLPTLWRYVWAGNSDQRAIVLRRDSVCRGWVRTFAVIVTDAIELIAEIHDRKPVILTRGDYLHWLSDELDPRRDLMRPFRPKPTWIWPISTRVDKPENDDPSMVEPIEISAA